MNWIGPQEPSQPVEARKKSAVGRTLASVVVTILLVSAVLVIAARRPVSIASPCLELPESIRDLGMIPAERVQSVDFVATNRGTRRLVLNEVNKNCRCSGFGIGTVIVPAGESRTITVTLDPRYESGPVRKLVNMASSDPACPRFQMVVLAQVQAAATSAAATDTGQSILVTDLDMSAANEPESAMHDELQERTSGFVISCFTRSRRRQSFVAPLRRDIYL
jgi:hypothetical protein